MDLLNDVIRIFATFPFLFFGLVGYFCGSLFRDTGIIKILIALLIVPFCLKFLTEINSLYIATFPFLIFALIGYLGINKSRFYLRDIYESIADQVRR